MSLPVSEVDGSEVDGSEVAHRSMRAEVLDTASGPMECAVTGEGPAVLLVHGTPGSWRQAAGLARDLADRHLVLLPSRPGYGRTPLAVGRTPAQQAAAYVSLLDAVGVEAAGVVGISGGGPSAAQLAQRHPGRTRALVQCCALAPHLMDPPRAMRFALGVPGLAEVGMRAQRWRQHRRLADEATTDRRIHAELTPAERKELASNPALRRSMIGFYLSHLDAPPPVRGLRNDLRSLGFGSGAGAPDLGDVSVPTLVLHGDVDRVVPMSHGEFYAGAIGGARLEVLPGAGHAFLITFRAASVERLRAALAVGS